MRTSSPLPALAAIGLAMAIGACAPSVAGGTYSRGQVGDINNVDRGVVVSSRTVKIEGTKSGVGTATGAVIGGAAGSQIGGGRAENVIAGVAGAVIGGIAGAAAEEGVTRTTGIEYVIALDDGRTITVVQGEDAPIAPGTRVMVLYGERARVVPQ